MSDMTSQNSPPNPVTQAADLVANDLDADVIHFEGSIERPADQMLIDACITRQRRQNVFLMLVTFGGDAGRGI